VERRLAAIMFVDIVGYTALMAQSEPKGLRARERQRALVERYHGEAIEARGDESLAVFPTALDAVNCALAIEEQLASDRDLKLHIGIHVGDFVLEHGEVSGDAVNIAARVRSFAEAGVCVSAEVYHSVRNQPNVEATALGEQELKNVGRPVALFALRGAAAPPRATTARPAAARESGPIRSLAVLPLENLSGDPSQEYFADGMTETLIGDLGKLRALRVISRTSVMRYRGARKPLPEIARELGVDALLEGTVIRDGERVRITAQLIDGRTDRHLWSERYDRELRGILELQSDVARAVARGIELELLPVESAQLANRRSVVSAAHDALLEGIHQVGRWSPALLPTAIASCERAIALDPGNAPAHAWLGLAWHMLTNDFAAVPHRLGMEKAKSAALRALQLDAELGEAHAALGMIALHLEWDWEASGRHFERALELNPSLAMAHSGQADHLTTRLHHEEAIARMRQAVELDPLSASRRTQLAFTCLGARRLAEALEHVQGALEIDRTFTMAHRVASFVNSTMGRHADAIEALERFGLSSEAVSGLRRALSRDGEQGLAREELRLFRSLPGTQRITLAALHARIGERDEAFAELEGAYALHDGQLIYLRASARFDPICDDPRFADLARRIGIPDD
jgi:TolB-like protein/tetratricopeptide (TPR) repeat protein